MDKQGLLVAVGARLEQAEHELAHSAIAYFDVVAAPSPDAELRDRYLALALGEAWRREKLRDLLREVRGMEDGTSAMKGAWVLFFALDSCEPVLIPSFIEWQRERLQPASHRASLPG